MTMGRPAKTAQRWYPSLTLATLFVRWNAVDPAVNTILIVVALEGGKFAFEIGLIPEQHLVEQLLPYRSDHSLDEGMRTRHKRQTFDLLYI